MTPDAVAAASRRRQFGARRALLQNLSSLYFVIFDRLSKMDRLRVW